MHVEIKPTNKILARCDNPRCGKPLINRAGDTLSLLGKGNKLFIERAGHLRLNGHCPGCNKPYSLSDFGALLVVKEGA